MDVNLIYRNMLIGGEPGSGKSGLLNAIIAQAALVDSTCLACPPGCSSCTRDESDCECYEHAHRHPDEPGEVA
jgi:predicted ATPase